MVDYRYGTQSNAYAAENDIIPRGGDEKDQKLSLSKNYLGDDGAPNDADDLLAAMGYKPELVRSRSTLQVAFMCFVLASIPYGLATTLYYPIIGEDRLPSFGVGLQYRASSSASLRLSARLRASYWY
tara:strand:+ start:2371 stop:2751 length:381 start_codon:yes stop_codon:yes gene_type:complete